MSDLLVCTVNIPAAGPSALEILEESCRFYGLDFDYWGKDYVGTYNSKQAKLEGMLDFLDRVSYPYVLFTDGWDSWMLSGEKATLDSYQSFKSPVVVCGHNRLHPSSVIGLAGVSGENFPEVPTRFRFICAGQFMGKREAVQEVLSKVLATNMLGSSDQGAWNVSFARGEITSLVKIDHNCELLLTMEGPLENLYFDSERRVVFKETNTRPIGIHFSGPKGGSPNGVNMKAFYQEWLKNR